MERVWAAMAGKKTYLLAGALALAVLALLIAGRLTPHTALILLLLAACGFPATFRSALARHQEEELELLTELAEAGTFLAAHNYSAAAVSAGQVAKLGAAIGSECKEEMQQA